MAKRKTALERDEQLLREMALDYPEAHEDHPWGHCAFKIRKKVFLFTSLEDGTLGLTVKLPASNKQALAFEFAEPTGYGLGKHGWVSARFSAKEKPPMGLLLQWLDESYRAVAPKKLVKLLDEGAES